MRLCGGLLAPRSFPHCLQSLLANLSMLCTRQYRCHCALTFSRTRRFSYEKGDATSTGARGVPYFKTSANKPCIGKAMGGPLTARLCAAETRRESGPRFPSIAG